MLASIAELVNPFVLQALLQLNKAISGETVVQMAWRFFARSDCFFGCSVVG
jgi:hypothetical protein